MKEHGTNWCIFGDCEAKQILQFQHSIFPPPVRNYANDMYPYACNSCKPLSANGQVAKQLKTSEPHNGLNEDLKGANLENADRSKTCFWTPTQQFTR